MINLKAIQSLRPNAEFIMTDDDPQTIIWHTEGITTPTLEEINAEIKRLEDEEAARVTSKAAAKESAQAKLAAIGLTPEEISALSNN